MANADHSEKPPWWPTQAQKERADKAHKEAMRLRNERDSRTPGGHNEAPFDEEPPRPAEPDSNY